MHVSLRVLGVLIAALATPAIADNNLTFHGYFRTTLGLSDGAFQPAFQAPGANSKYRLGNEPDTNLELAWDYRFPQSNKAQEGSYIQGFFMLAGYQPVGSSSKLGTPDVAQAYIKFAQYLGSTDLWIGRRYYQRMDIHINDHFWLNAGQGAHVGAGAENIKLGSTQLDLALFNYEDPDVPSLLNPAETGTLHSRLLDMRVHKISSSELAQVNAWLAYASRPKDEVLGFKKEDGFGAALWMDSKFGTSDNTLLFIHRQGLALVQGDFNARPIRENFASGYEIDKATMSEMNNKYTLNADQYSLQFVLLARQEETGKDGLKGDKIDWKSAGIRPLYYFNDVTNLALELGYDHVDNKITDLQGSVFKQTLALQLAKDMGFFARPNLRLFVTNANWSSDFKGLTGGSIYKDQTSGWSAGFQSEVWW